MVAVAIGWQVYELDRNAFVRLGQELMDSVERELAGRRAVGAVRPPHTEQAPPGPLDAQVGGIEASGCKVAGAYLKEGHAVAEILGDLGATELRGVFRDAVDGSTLTVIDFGKTFLARYGYPYVVAHRRDVLDALLVACRAESRIVLEHDRTVVCQVLTSGAAAGAVSVDVGGGRLI
jgi:hypothetical protein